jgi:hypothetical protein
VLPPQRFEIGTPGGESEQIPHPVELDRLQFDLQGFGIATETIQEDVHDVLQPRLDPTLALGFLNDLLVKR